MVGERTVAVLDASVLLAHDLRSLLLHLAVAGTYQPHWNAAILSEFASQYAEASQWIDWMGRVLPEADVPQGLHQAAVPAPGHPRTHVIEVALVARAGVIVALRPEDFPHQVLATWDVSVWTPDYFLVEVYDEHRDSVVTAFANWIGNRRQQGQIPQEVLQGVAHHAPSFADRITVHHQVQVLLKQ